MCNRHHCFIETVDRRIVLPVQRAVKCEFLFRERTEFLNRNVFDRYAWFWFGSILAVSGLPFRFADRLQLSEKIVSKETRVRIVRIIGPTVGFHLFGGFRLRWLDRFLLSFRRLIRCNRLDYPLFGSLCQFRVLQLLTYSHTFTGPHKFRQIGVKSMMGKSRQFYSIVNTVHPAGQCNAQYLRCFNRILSENLVEITDTEHKNGIGTFLFHLLILFEQRLILLFNLLGKRFLFR